MTITFLAVCWLRQPVPPVIVTDCPMTTTFFKMAPYRMAIMNEDDWKNDKNHKRDLTNNLVT